MACSPVEAMKNGSAEVDSATQPAGEDTEETCPAVEDEASPSDDNKAKAIFLPRRPDRLARKRHVHFSSDEARESSRKSARFEDKASETSDERDSKYVQTDTASVSSAASEINPAASETDPSVFELAVSALQTLLFAGADNRPSSKSGDNDSEELRQYSQGLEMLIKITILLTCGLMLGFRLITVIICTIIFFVAWSIIKAR